MSKSKDDSATDYKPTLNLPRTDFPMRADLVKREPERLEHWEAQNLYRQIVEKRKAEGGRTSFSMTVRPSPMAMSTWAPP